MRNLKFIIDIDGNNVRTIGFDTDNNITLEEAGLSHTDLDATEEITEYFEERYSEDNVTVEFLLSAKQTNFNQIKKI